MKKILVGTIAVLGMSVGAAFGVGEPGTGILGSVHDMTINANAGAAGDPQGRICAFCHTPHHAYQGNADQYYPLWSRKLDNTVFTPYASSTINSIATQNADIAIGPTRLCMSCHDGSIAIDQHYGATFGNKTLTETANSLVDIEWLSGPAIGKGPRGLSNDHPVGFDYVAVAAGPDSGDPANAAALNVGADQDPWIRAATANLTYGGKYNIKVDDRLYVDPTTGVKYMTCATCHDVHNKKNQDLNDGSQNYLVLAPQAGSALCLVCHIK